MENLLTPIEPPEVSGNLLATVGPPEVSGNLLVPVGPPEVSGNLVDEYREILSPPTSSDEEVKA